MCSSCVNIAGKLKRVILKGFHKASNKGHPQRLEIVIVASFYTVSSLLCLFWDNHSDPSFSRSILILSMLFSNLASVFIFLPFFRELDHNIQIGSVPACSAMTASVKFSESQRLILPVSPVGNKTNDALEVTGSRSEKIWRNTVTAEVNCCCPIFTLVSKKRWSLRGGGWSLSKSHLVFFCSGQVGRQA